jgi:dephospho-CoA kinase
MKIYEVITEAFNDPYPVNWFQKTQEVWEGSAQLPDGSKLFIDITESDEGYYTIEFSRSDSKGMGATMKATGEGNEFRIFATVQAGILEWWKSVDEDDVQKITFNASKQADDSKNRHKLYARFAKQWASKIGWVATSREEDGSISFVLIKPQAAKFAKDQDLEVMEGVNDPGIFKAVFLAGGPGSGKSFVVRDTGVASSMGLKLLNSDSAFEAYMKQAEMETTPDNIMSPAGQELRDKAKNVVKKQTSHYMNERLGLVLDGTGKDYDKITSQATRLKKLGYDVAMVFVNTDIETALERNEKRKRSLPEDMITKMWKDVQLNIGKFQSYFNQNMYIMDNSNSADSSAGTNEIYKRLTQFIQAPPKSGIAQNWIKKQQSK